MSGVPDSLPALAQAAVETFVNSGQLLPPPDQGYATFRQQQAGVFVTLKTLNGDLRGCIGTISPVYTNILEETISNAVAAASRDPRFPAVQPSELPSLSYSVSVLHPPEAISSLTELDPQKYGVIVSARQRRGLLLPELEGLDTAEKQVEHAMFKAGLRPGEPVALQRFQVDKYT